jgi:adenylate cyclase
MGFEARFDYSCIGDTVNVASRVEGACRAVGYDILVAAETRAAAPELAFLAAGSLVLKGVSQREPIYLLVGNADLARSAPFAALAPKHEALLACWQGTGDGAGAALAHCRALAEAVDPRLLDFYDACPGRAGDFAGADPAVEGRVATAL